MDERQHRIESFNRFQKSDRRAGVDGCGLDHPGLTSCQVEGAMNIDALTSAGLLDRQLVLLWRPAADRPRRMGRVHGVRACGTPVLAFRNGSSSRTIRTQA